MPSRLPTLVAVGPWQHGEYAGLRAELDPSGAWSTLSSLSALCESLASASSGNVPEVVLLAQPTPGDDLQPQIERLQTLAPLTRMVAVAGSWCEGELRTGRPLEGVVRLYWYEFTPWWRAALAAWNAGRRPAWSEPLDDVRAGQQTPLVTAPPANGRSEHRRLAVAAADFAVFETLAAVLAPYGWQCVWERPAGTAVTGSTSPPTPAAGIWDGGQLSAPELQSLQQFSQQIHALNPAAPIIALLDFPRAEHLAAVRDAGAAALLAKPYQLTQLVNELARLTASHAAD